MSDAPAESVYENHHYYFCSDRCRERVEERPERYMADMANFERMDSNEHQHDSATTAIDPVCGMTVDKATAATHVTFEGTDFWFCNVSCAETFDTDPGRYLVSH